MLYYVVMTYCVQSEDLGTQAGKEVLAAYTSKTAADKRALSEKRLIERFGVQAHFNVSVEKEGSI